MTVPSQVGSITEIKSSAGSGSQSVTVPSGATLLLVLTAWWQTGVPDYTTLSLNGVDFKANKVVENASDSYESTNIYYLKSPATGTFSWAISTSEGAHIFLLFLKDTDPTSPIRASNYGQSNSDPVTGSFSSSTNDLIVGVGCGYGATSADAGVSGQTEIYDGGNYNSAYGVLGTKAGVSGTTTFTVDFSGSGMSNSVCAVSIAGSSGDVSVSGAGAIASSEAFGTAVISVNEAPTGIASSEAIGTQSIQASLTGITGIASVEALGTPVLSLGVSPSGVASGEAFGSSALSMDVAGAGNIASAETIGTPSGAPVVSISGIASGEAVGSPETSLLISPSSISSSETFGTPVLSGTPVDLSGVGDIASLEAFGAPGVDASVSISGISSSETFGNPVLAVDVAGIGNIASGETFGTPNVSTAAPANVTDVGNISSSEAFGTPTVDLIVSISGIVSGEAVGSPETSLLISSFGVSSGETFGIPSISGDAVTISGAGNIVSAEQFEIPVLSVWIEPAGIASDEGFGLPTLDTESSITLMNVGGISSGELFGTLLISSIRMGAQRKISKSLADWDTPLSGIAPKPRRSKKI